MPTYDYRCDDCQAEFETVQSIHDEALRDCPQCGKPKLYRLISGAGVIFKGSGFYVNDSKKPPAKSTTASTPAKEKESVPAKEGEKTAPQAANSKSSADSAKKAPAKAS